MPEPEQPIIETNRTDNRYEFYIKYKGVGITAKGNKGIYEITVSTLEYDLENRLTEKPFGNSMTGMYLGSKQGVMNLARKIRKLTERMSGGRAFGDPEEQRITDIILQHTAPKTNKQATYAGNPNEAFLKEQKERWGEVIWLIVHKGYAREEAERELGYTK
jgi:hypothetical protein